MNKLLLFLFMTVPLMASNVIIFQPASAPVTNRVVAYHRDVNTLGWQGVTNVLINPTVPVNGTAADWKVTNGVVLELSTADRTAITNAQVAAAAAGKAAEETAAKPAATNAVENFLPDGRLLRALAEAMMDEINIVRTNPTAVLPARTLIQLKNTIRTKIAAQPDTGP